MQLFAHFSNKINENAFTEQNALLANSVMFVLNYINVKCIG